MRQPHVQEAVGYTGEGVVLEATALGLGTCWVAGFFRPAAVTQRLNIASYERVLAVSPLGYAPLEKTLGEKIIKGFAHNRKRKPLTQLVNGLPENEWPGWLKSALEAARIAPSATNRQPWRFDIQNGSVTVATDPGNLDFKASKRLDCGIAMLHLEISALNCGVHGRWELGEAPVVGRFTYEK
jgi:nitroreductase